jgi:hypothetical protein
MQKPPNRPTCADTAEQRDNDARGVICLIENLGCVH